MLDIIKQELIDNNEDYVVVQNGVVIDSSREGLNLEFKEDISLKVIHIINQDATINYLVNSGIDVKLSEIFYEVTNNPKIELILKIMQNAKCDYTSLRRANCNEIMTNVNAFLYQSSYLNYKTLSTYHSNGMLNENFYLEEKNALTDIKNVLISTSGNKQDFNININHNEKSTISNLLNYGITKNNSTLTINSKGIIKKDCNKSEIRQRAKGLLLDETSSISANPLLEIDNYDVIANHGASIGAIDETELYYLMSRGLQREEAEKVIVNGFINPVLSLVKEGKFQDYLIRWINKNI